MERSRFGGGRRRKYLGDDVTGESCGRPNAAGGQVGRRDRLIWQKQGIYLPLLETWAGGGWVGGTRTFSLH
jgi:hypothetical protein